MAAGATARVGGGRIGGRARYVIGTCRLAAVQSRLPSLRVRGLMTLALFGADPDRVRVCFRRLRELRDRLREQAPDGVDLDSWFRS